jgi:hypothetical protein
VLWDKWNPIARLDLDCSLQSLETFRRFIIAAIAFAIHRLLALIRRIQERIATAQPDTPDARP